MSNQEKVAIIGSGLIGRSWTMLFASAGYSVSVYDIDSTIVDGALKEIKVQLKRLEEAGNLKGKLTAEQQFKLCSGTSELKSCLANAFYVQECIPEKFEWKVKLYAEIDQLITPSQSKIIIASSTSNMLPSKLSKALKHKNRFVVAHPINPPYYMPLVEVVVAPWTDPDVPETTRTILRKLGQQPVVLNKELPGFLLNRIQYAILNECWRLVGGGYATAEDVDTVMTAGLGRRYAVLGPLAACHLNAAGMGAYIDAYADGVHDVAATSEGIPHMKKDTKTAEVVVKHLEAQVPLDKLEERKAWRDTSLAELDKLLTRVNNSQ